MSEVHDHDNPDEPADEPTDEPADEPADATLADAVRDAVEAAVPGPTDAERTRMDTAVFAALAARGDGDAAAAATGPATGAGTSCEAAPVPLRPGSRRKPSPRARGKRAMPYFVAAAAIAVVLSVGISIIATGLQPGPSTDSAAVEFSVDAPNADSSADASPDVSSEATQSGATATTDAADAPSPAGARSGTPGAEPELFLTNEAFADEADLVALAKRAPLATVPPEVARSELTRTAEGLPAVTDLPACLAALPPAFVPMRVETGTWQGADVFFVSGSPVAGNVAVYVLARTTCSPVTSISLD